MKTLYTGDGYKLDREMQAELKRKLKPQPMQLKIRALIAWVFMAAMIAINALANILPINGMNTGEISALYPNRFVPDGFTFSIWSLIYFLLLAFVVMSTVTAWKRGGTPVSSLTYQLLPWFLITCVLNAGWIIAWHYLQVGLSVLIMLIFLITLIRIYLILHPHQQLLSPGQRIWIYTPFVVYLGWISVATIANITALLVSQQWGGWGFDPSGWSIAMILIASALGLVFGWFRKDAAYALVIAWALFGIYRGQHLNYPEVAQVAKISSSALITAVIAQALVSMFRSKA